MDCHQPSASSAAGGLAFPTLPSQEGCGKGTPCPGMHPEGAAPAGEARMRSTKDQVQRVGPGHRVRCERVVMSWIRLANPTELTRRRRDDHLGRPSGARTNTDEVNLSV